MVVRVAHAARRRACSARRLLRRPALVLAGIVLLPAYLGDIFPPAHAQDIRSDDRIVGMPHLRDRPMAGEPRACPEKRGLCGNFIAPQGAPLPNMWFATGSLNPNMNQVIGLNLLGRPGRQGSDRFVTSAIHSAVSNGASGPGMSRGPMRPTPRPRPWGGILPTCSDDEVETQLQAGGQFWGAQARSVAATQFPRDVFTFNARGSADPLALGPTGHPVNLPLEGPAGSWCRPPPVPMSRSSPFETHWFWILLLFPLMVVIVFGLTRGYRIRAIHDG